MKYVKAILSTAGGFLLGLFGKMSIPIYVLVSCNVIDYITGIFSAKAKGEKITSKRGYQGIVKKICMWILVIVGWFLDVIIARAGQEIGVEFKVKCTVAFITCIWLILSELMSILENISSIGVRIPSFLMKIVNWMNGKVEEAGDNVVPKGDVKNE